MPKLRIVGFSDHVRKVQLVSMLLSYRFCEDIKSAMKCLKEVSFGKEFEFEVEYDEDAQEIADNLQTYGLVVVLELDKSLN